MRYLIVICGLLWIRPGYSQQTVLQQDLQLPYLVKTPAATAGLAPMVLLLHGYGSNEADLFDLKDIFPASFIVVSARAPLPVSNSGYQWYHMRMSGGRRDANARELAEVTERLRKLITALTAKYHADPGKVYVMGFSQGGIMSYQLGLHHPELLRGIGVWSGRLLPASEQSIGNVRALGRLKVFIGHGTEDPVIPFSDAVAARDFLQRSGVQAEFYSYNGMKHQIAEQELKDIRDWISKQ